ncbi:MAG: transcription antitermination factor NusB, partial [Myxococcota bacterium]
LGALDLEVLTALRLGVYQMLWLDRIPAHAAVDQSVRLAKKAKGRGAGGFVNGVLRNVIRKRDSIPSDDPSWSLGMRTSMPDELAGELTERFGDVLGARVAQAFTTRAPLFVRTAAPWDGLVAVEGVPGAFRAPRWSKELEEALASGRAAVQDLGAQLIGWYTGAKTGQRVLDGCAGLGGKTLHLAEMVGEPVWAVEPRESKRALLEQGAKVRGRTVHVLAGGLEGATRELEPASFDVVLLDVPCTGLGVLRRHPETRWRRTLGDVPALVQLQRELLEVGRRLVAPGGSLVYSVCTFTRAEGPRQMEEFLAAHPEFSRAGAPELEALEGYVDARGDLVVDPARHDTDAFYAARLVRAS